MHQTSIYGVAKGARPRPGRASVWGAPADAFRLSRGGDPREGSKETPRRLAWESDSHRDLPLERRMLLSRLCVPRQRGPGGWRLSYGAVRLARVELATTGLKDRSS